MGVLLLVVRMLHVLLMLEMLRVLEVLEMLWLLVRVRVHLLGGLRSDKPLRRSNWSGYRYKWLWSQCIDMALEYLQLFLGRLPGGDDPHESLQLGIFGGPDCQRLDNGIGPRWSWLLRVWGLLGVILRVLRVLWMLRVLQMLRVLLVLLLMLRVLLQVLLLLLLWSKVHRALGRSLSRHIVLWSSSNMSLGSRLLMRYRWRLHLLLYRLRSPRKRGSLLYPINRLHLLWLRLSLQSLRLRLWLRLRRSRSGGRRCGRGFDGLENAEKLDLELVRLAAQRGTPEPGHAVLPRVLLHLDGVEPA